MLFQKNKTNKLLSAYKKQKIILLGTLVFTVPLFLNYMHFTLNSDYRWPGNTVTVVMNINPDFSGMDGSSDGFQLLQGVRDAMMDWFRYGKARIVLKEGSNNKNTPRGTESLTCGFALSDGLVNSEVNLFASRTDDPDCSGKSCVFQWSCAEENKPAVVDVQFNAYRYRWTSENAAADGPVNIKEESLHAIGHVMGLNHCLPGETESECSFNIAPGMSDPLENSVMYKFSDTGNLSPAEDDSMGLIKLYGKLDLPFDTEGKYALSDSDVNTLMKQITLDSLYFPDTNSRKNASDQLKQLGEYIEKQTGEDLYNITDKYYAASIAGVAGSSKEDLIIGRNLSTLGMYSAYLQLKDIDEGISGMDRNLTELAFTKQKELREATIDALSNME